MKHNIVIVDDHLLIAKAIANIVEGFRDFNVLYEADNGQSLITQFKQKKNIPDVVLLDISMPVMDGFETASWLKEHHPEILVMALSVQDDEETLIRMIRNGARGYLHKNVHPAELEKALYTLVNKGMYYPDWATNKVFLKIAHPDDQHPGGLPKLNDREIEFLQHAATELTYKEIAEKMFCSPRTVENYRDGLFEKFGLNTRLGIVLFALRKGIIRL